MRRYWPILFLALCALLPLWRCVLNGEVIGPFDQIRHMQPWGDPQATKPFDILQADGVLQFYPWRDLVFQAWGKGQLPLWNPYELAGTPLLGNSQSAGFYPPHILCGALHLPTGFAMALLAWFHLFWSGLGTYFLTRKLGGSRTGAATAGVAFELSPFMLAWTGLPSVITTVCWIPWILGLIVAVFGERDATAPVLANPGEGFDRQIGGRLLGSHRTKAAALAVCTAMLVLGGHLQFAAYGLMAAGLLTVWMFGIEVTDAQHLSPEESRTRVYRNEALSALGRVVIAVVLGLMLAAPQLLPVLNYSKFSHRANTATAEGYEAYVGGGIPAVALQGIAFPTAVGNPARFSPKVQELNAYWPALVHRGADFAETALGVGPLVFVLLFFLRRPRGAVAALAATGVLSLLLGLGTILNWPFYFLVPGWSATGSPGRAVVLFVLAACVLAGLALPRLSDVSNFRAIALLTGLAGLLVALVPIVFGIAYSDTEIINQAVRASVLVEFPIFAATLAIALGAVFAARSSGRYAAATPIAAAVCAFAAYGWNLVPTAPSALGAQSGNSQERYAFINRGWDFIPGPALMPPNTAIYSRIHDIGGYDSLLHRDSAAMMRAIDGEDPAPPTNGNIMLVKPKADPAKLAQAGVAHVWSLRSIPSFGPPARETKDWVEYDLAGKGRAYTDVGPAQILDEGLDHLRVTASGPSTLTVKDRMMDGWSATVDGHPAEITGAGLSREDEPTPEHPLWRHVKLPQGQHTVEFRYFPPGLKTGCWLALLSAAILVVLTAKMGPGRSKPAIRDA